MAESHGRRSRCRGTEIAVGELRVTVAGSSCSVPRYDRACSAYLLQDGNLAVALDFGTGAFANMRRYADYDRLDAVVISHMHADHFLDLIPLRYALRYGQKRRADLMPLWLPPGGMNMLRTMTSAFASEGSADFLDAAFDMREFDPAVALPIGNGSLRFAKTTHYIDSYAVRYARNGSSVTYSGDTAPDDRVIDLAHKTDLFLCESTLLAHECESGDVRGHSTAADAGRMAADADVKRLVLTHYAQDATERDLAGSAREHFSGPLDVADDHAVLRVD